MRGKRGLTASGLDRAACGTGREASTWECGIMMSGWDRSFLQDGGMRGGQGQGLPGVTIVTSWHLSCTHPALMIFPISLGYWVFSSKFFTSGEGGVACHCQAAVTVLLRDVAECPPQSSHQVMLFCILCPCTLGGGCFLPYLGSGEFTFQSAG